MSWECGLTGLQEANWRAAGFRREGEEVLSIRIEGNSCWKKVRLSSADACFKSVFDQANALWYVFAEDVNIVPDMLIRLKPYRMKPVAEIKKMAASKSRWLGRADSVNRPVAAPTRF